MAVALAEQPEQNVLGADPGVIEHPGFYSARTTTRRARSVNRSAMLRAALLTVISGYTRCQHDKSDLQRPAAPHTAGTIPDPAFTGLVLSSWCSCYLAVPHPELNSAGPPRRTWR
jgi:hypothetical protein